MYNFLVTRRLGGKSNQDTLKTYTKVYFITERSQILLKNLQLYAEKEKKVNFVVLDK